ncbi:MAG TPA: hypothetical protein P5102_07580 [Candidatus Competibacteraceae bacterium]|nr:hypothetical protein [Candidatus Competibacteraceae bacterium]HRZ05998.1 hypothetical protein [Candidatus Competibacteraceae bacterium]HSA46643.1 hypothetical protein [Candidatus Competibacteraceae bacterium]
MEPLTDNRVSAAMPDFLRKFIGLMLIFAAVGVASCQALVASCSSSAAPMHTLR